MATSQVIIETNLQYRCLATSAPKNVFKDKTPGRCRPSMYNYTSKEGGGLTTTTTTPLSAKPPLRQPPENPSMAQRQNHFYPGILAAGQRVPAAAKPRHEPQKYPHRKHVASTTVPHFSKSLASFDPSTNKQETLPFSYLYGAATSRNAATVELAACITVSPPGC